VGPGVHVGAPLELELLLPLVMGAHMPLPMPPAFSHWLGQASARQFAVALETEDAGPQLSALVHAATVPPWNRQPTRQEQLVSTAHAW
jgi:hypothetical protein